jgi:hypothetical protein
LKSSLYFWKALGMYISKMACMTQLDTSNTSYGQKKGRESKWQFDSWPLKVRNRPNFLAFRWRAISVGNLLTRTITLFQSSSQSKVYKQSYEAPKLREPQLWKFRDSHLGVLRQNDIWIPAMHMIYYKGEGGGFPHVRAMVSLMSLSLFVARHSTKNAPTMH